MGRRQSGSPRLRLLLRARRGARDQDRGRPLRGAEGDTLIATTARPNWDDEGGQAIPESAWDEVRKIAEYVSQRCPLLPPPHVSADGYGGRYLHWANKNGSLDAEIRADGRMFCIVVTVRETTCVEDFGTCGVMIGGAPI